MTLTLTITLLKRYPYPDDDTVAGTGSYHDVSARDVRAQRHDQLEVPLVRVGPTLLPHVVIGGLRKVETADGDLGAFAAEFDPEIILIISFSHEAFSRFFPLAHLV